eukprot:scaffold33002_cov32-Tisochrysis_lutea.AAC.2
MFWGAPRVAHCSFIARVPRGCRRAAHADASRCTPGDPPAARRTVRVIFRSGSRDRTSVCSLVSGSAIKTAVSSVRSSIESAWICAQMAGGREVRWQQSSCSAH